MKKPLKHVMWTICVITTLILMAALATFYWAWLREAFCVVKVVDRNVN
jgi:hypothetical protein